MTIGTVNVQWNLDEQRRMRAMEMLAGENARLAVCRIGVDLLRLPIMVADSSVAWYGRWGGCYALLVVSTLGSE